MTGSNPELRNSAGLFEQSSYPRLSSPRNLKHLNVCIDVKANMMEYKKQHSPVAITEVLFTCKKTLVGIHNQCQGLNYGQ